MKALITGASSGIGRDMAKVLSNKGYDLIIVARNEALLNEVKKSLKTSCTVIAMDLSEDNAPFKLHEMVKDEDIDILINNAGFGVFGEFSETDIDKELNMINLNIKTVHILTKLFLKDFKKRDSGYILNVASSAGFCPGGPLLSTYYATKAYVLSLTRSIYEELRHEGSNVYIGALCPGPVDTGFNDRAGVRFSLKGMKSMEVAEYAIKMMNKRKLVIIPGVSMKFTKYGQRFLSDKFVLKFAYNFQKKKQ